MKIGIDFDNTIAGYDVLFMKVALVEGMIDRKWDGTGKTELRDYLCRQSNGEKIWMKLQGLVYGKYMHCADMLPGVANFLLKCKTQNHKIFIVSHKTEFGHFDPQKISLRQEALKWMETKRFFDKNYFSIERDNVIFTNTREEKVNKISQLKCDWFIDDLPEVFNESYFPYNTKKILFGLFIRAKLSEDTTVLDSWRKISEKILGITTNDDILAWASHLTEYPIAKLKKISGRGNSRVYKVTTTAGNCYALKHYLDQASDNRPRLKTEFNALQIMHEYEITNLPKAINKSDDLNLGLYEWINGKKLTKPSADDLDQAIDFIKKLYSLSQKVDGNIINQASEACLSARELKDQIDNRLFKLKLVKENFPGLSFFLDRTFEPLWVKVRNESFFLWPLETLDDTLPKEKQILSPSDFGFHNSLKSDEGVLTFIDFDYFGWDDPIKLTADFLWHPAMKLNTNLKEKWKQAMLELTSDDHYFKARFNAAMPLYGLRWAMIVLNEFLPGFAERRKEAGELENYNLEKSQKKQLKKAKYYCDKVKTMVSQVTFA